MEFVRKFLRVEELIGQGAFGRVLLTSPLQNLNLPQNHIQQNPHHDRQKKFSHSSSHALDSENNRLNGRDSENSIQQTPPQQQLQQCDKFALKYILPIVKPQRLCSELRFLRDLGGRNNVVQLHAAHFYKGALYIVMELIEHVRFTDYVADMDYEEIVMYMRNLLIALEHVHSNNVMHRDIKPGNFLYNRKYKKFLLIDFGLAQKTRSPPAPPSIQRSGLTSTPTSYHNSISLLNPPKTPTSTNSKRIMTPLFPEFHDKRKDNPTAVSNNLLFNIGGTTPIKQSPVRRYIDLTSGSPNTPSTSIKRQKSRLESEDLLENQLNKKLRMSNNNEELREPVRLTVGAYESPVTTNDVGMKRTTVDNHKFSTPIPLSRLKSLPKCGCYGKPKSCKICTSKPEPTAPKSGTPGYKAPEILLRYPNQNTAVDIWSAGVIFANLLSGHSPLFRDTDDTTSLAEVITILGSQKVINAAKALGIVLIQEPKREPIDLAYMCKTIRLRRKDTRQIDVPDIAFDLLKRMLDPNPQTRITARDALWHPWFKYHKITEV